MPITTVDGLVAGMAARAPYSWSKASTAVKGINTWVSHWLTAGLPGAAAAPTTLNGVTLSNATAGSWGQANPTSGNLHLAGASIASSGIAGLLVIEDRLWHNLLNLNTAVAQAITTPALPARDATGTTAGVGCELWFECYTATPATATNVTVTYTNSSGVAGRTTPATTINASATVGQRVQIPLAAGDVGIQSIQSVILSAAVATGTGGLVISRRLASLPVGTQQPPTYDFNDVGLPRVFNGACLATNWFSQSATATALTAMVRFAEG